MNNQQLGMLLRTLKHGFVSAVVKRIAVDGARAVDLWLPTIEQDAQLRETVSRLTREKLFSK